MSAYTAAYWIYGVGLFLSTIFFLQRVYTKCRIVGNFSAEDWILLAAFIFSVGTQAVGIGLFANHAIGIPRPELSMAQVKQFAVAMVVAPTLYGPATCFAKLTLLIFYLKISPQVWFLRITKVVIWVVVGYSIGITLSNVFACHPIQLSWAPYRPASNCINADALYIATAGLGIATDITMLVLPIPVILPLQMSMRRKVEVLVVFMLGSLTFVTSIVRMILLLPMLERADTGLSATWPVIWVGIEANLQVICASVTTLRKFLQTIMPRIFNEVSRDSERIESLRLRTFGQSSSSSRRKDRQFDDGDAALICEEDENIKQPLSSLRPDVHPGQFMVAISRGTRTSRDLLSRQLSDSGSEKGILQTRTTVVTTEWRKF